MPIGHRIFFRALLRMARAWEKLAVHNGHVDWSNGIPTIVVDSVKGLGGATDYSNFSFGFSVEGAVVTQKNGRVDFTTYSQDTPGGPPYLLTARSALSGTATGGDITITDDVDATYIYVEILHTPSLTAVIKSATSLGSGVNANGANWLLSKWLLVGDSAVLQEIYHLGAIMQSLVKIL